MGSMGNVDSTHAQHIHSHSHMSPNKKTFVKASKEHFRAQRKAASPSAVRISWTTISKSKSFEKRMKMITNAEVGVALLRERAVMDEAEKEKQREANRAEVLARHTSSAAGSSGSKKLIKSVYARNYSRPGFTGRRPAAVAAPQPGAWWFGLQVVALHCLRPIACPHDAVHQRVSPTTRRPTRRRPSQSSPCTLSTRWRCLKWQAPRALGVRRTGDDYNERSRRASKGKGRGAAPRTVCELSSSRAHIQCMFYVLLTVRQTVTKPHMTK